MSPSQKLKSSKGWKWRRARNKEIGSLPYLQDKKRGVKSLYVENCEMNSKKLRSDVQERVESDTVICEVEAVSQPCYIQKNFKLKLSKA